jgi:hypothetical protein
MDALDLPALRCPICGTAFQPLHSELTCSIECRRERARRRSHEQWLANFPEYARKREARREANREAHEARLRGYEAIRARNKERLRERQAEREAMRQFTRKDRVERGLILIAQRGVIRALREAEREAKREAKLLRKSAAYRKAKREAERQHIFEAWRVYREAPYYRAIRKRLRDARLATWRNAALPGLGASRTAAPRPPAIVRAERSSWPPVRLLILEALERMTPMHTQFRIYYPDGRITTHDHIFQLRWPSLADIKGVVEPALGTPDCEHVRVFWAWKEGGHAEYLDLFVDEDGIAKGLPINSAATEVYHANVKHHDPRGLGSPEALAIAPKIHGTAVLFKDKIWS